jgi:hypothetical protein
MVASRISGVLSGRLSVNAILTVSLIVSCLSPSAVASEVTPGEPSNQFFAPSRLVHRGSGRLRHHNEEVVAKKDVHPEIVAIRETIEKLAAADRFDLASCEALRWLLSPQNLTRNSFSAQVGAEVIADIRAEAARAFYLAFYDLRGVESAVTAYLRRDDIHAEFARALSPLEPKLEVRWAFAQIGQTVALQLPPSQRDEFVEAYAPLFLAGLRDSSPEQRQEVLVALDNFSEASTLRSPRTWQALESAKSASADEDMRHLRRKA